MGEVEPLVISFQDKLLGKKLQQVGHFVPVTDLGATNSSGEDCGFYVDLHLLSFKFTLQRVFVVHILNSACSVRLTHPEGDGPWRFMWSVFV